MSSLNIFFLFPCSEHRDLHSFPTRRSSDLSLPGTMLVTPEVDSSSNGITRGESESTSDRKSTRLNSSHVEISYAVFCLKKKRRNKTNCLVAYQYKLGALVFRT